MDSTNLQFELRPEFSSPKSVVPICFIVEKFPREVKYLSQGSREVKGRNHPNCIPLGICDLIRQPGPFSGNLASGAIGWGPTDHLAYLNNLCSPPNMQNWSGGEGVIILFYTDKLMLHLPSLSQVAMFQHTDVIILHRHVPICHNMWLGRSQANQ